jgi:hypothetical protein
VLLITAGWAGCFAPSYVDGNLRCADGATPCPDGYYCAITHAGQPGSCWRNGHAPPRPAAPVTVSAGGAVGVTSPQSHGLSISVGQPLVGSASAAGDHTLQLGVMRGAVSK